MNEQLNREKIIVKTSVVGIVVNLMLAAFKAAVGILSNSIAVVLDAVIHRRRCNQHFIVIQSDRKIAPGTI